MQPYIILRLNVVRRYPALMHINNNMFDHVAMIPSSCHRTIILCLRIPQLGFSNPTQYTKLPHIIQSSHTEYKAPTHYTKPPHNIQSSHTLYKTPNPYTKPPTHTRESHCRLVNTFRDARTSLISFRSLHPQPCVLFCFLLLCVVLFFVVIVFELHT